jgi:hypothetical protein
MSFHLSHRSPRRRFFVSIAHGFVSFALVSFALVSFALVSFALVSFALVRFALGEMEKSMFVLIAGIMLAMVVAMMDLLSSLSLNI